MLCDNVSECTFNSFKGPSYLHSIAFCPVNKQHLNDGKRVYNKGSGLFIIIDQSIAHDLLHYNIDNTGSPEKP